ncbi:unnamed protein product [Prunus armeniaca]
MWLLHPTFRSFVVDKWANYTGNILQKTQDLSKALAVWNKDVFGCLFQNKKKLLAIIGGIQKALCRRHSSFLVDLEKELASDYQALLDQEELFWLQKSRNTWLKEGDRNTKFFHLSTIIHRRRNKLEGLTNAQVQTMRYSNADLPQLFPRLETSELGTFVELIAGCFSTASIPDALNDTLITLVPKVASPSSVAQLRRISLCNTKYKVVIKIIVQKLRPLMQKVVSPAQASFIPGMQIVDNIIVAQKVNYLFLSCSELTERFSPSAGIRQGDPLYPYIFVLCMEKLSHIINDHVSSGTWNLELPRILTLGLLTKCSVDWLLGRVTHYLWQLDKLNRDFLWGYTGDKTKLHLVNWDTVCQPKSCGGLGIKKKTHCMNQALLAKTSWKIFQKDQGLWSQVLNGKYLKDQSLLATPNLKFLNCPSTWRGILFGSQIVSKWLKWRVGNGDNILFWKDNWAGCGPLENFATISLSDDLLEWTMSDFLTKQGWNTNWLLGCLPLDKVQKIHCTHAGFNLIILRWTLVYGSLPPMKLHVPPKIKTFVWLLFQAKLLTNVQRVRRNLASNPNYPCCNISMESLDHLFRRTDFSSILRLVSAACKVSLGPLCSWPPCGFVGNGDVRKFLMSTLLLLIGPTFQSFNLLGSGWWLTAPGILRLPNKFLSNIGLLLVLAVLKLMRMAVVWVRWDLLVLEAS